MKTKRIFPPHSRLSGVRSPKLIIIASEGANTERIYFEDMASPRYYRTSKVHVEILKRDDPALSSPTYVLSSLDNFKKKYRLALKKDDELWLVIDRDKWTFQELSSVAAQCQQKCYLLAVSNPCFELWLLLHVKSLDDYNATEYDLIAKNDRISGNRTFLEGELITLLGSYNKDNPDTSKFLPWVNIAISRAKILDTSPTDRWPNSIGTHVYRLAENIKNS